MREKLLFRFLIMLILLLALSSCNSSTSCTTCTIGQANVILDGSAGGVADQDKNTSLNPMIVLKYSQPMRPETVTPYTVFLSTSAAVRSSVPIIPLSNMTANVDNTSFSFSPTSALLPDTVYYITVTNANQTADGIPVSNQFSFMTGSVSSPSVTIVTPDNGSTNNTLNPNIQLQFSEEVQNVNPTTVTLHSGNINGTIIPISVITVGGNNTYTFSPTNALNPLTIYYVVLSDAITDLNNKSIEPVNFHFTTKSGSSDETNPSVSLINPSNNAIGVSKTPSIQLRFSEAVQNVNATTITLHLNSIDGDIVPIGSITAEDNNTYTFSSQSELSSLTTYYIVLGSAITDTSGNHLPNASFNFTTGDFTAPAATILEPANNATNIGLNPTIKVQFDKAVQNVNSTTMTLHIGSPNEDTVAIGQITEDGENTYSFKPSIGLSPNVNYYVVVSDQITDVVGNLLTPTNFHFTTANILGAAYLVSRDTGGIYMCYINQDWSLGDCNITASFSVLRSAVILSSDRKSAYILNTQLNELEQCAVNSDKTLSECTSIATTPTNANVMTMNTAQTMVYFSNTFPNSVVYACPFSNNVLGTCVSASSEVFQYPISITINPAGTIAYIASFEVPLGNVKACPILGDGSFGACNIIFAGISDPTNVTFNLAGNKAYIGQYTSNSMNLCDVNTDGSFANCNPMSSSFSGPAGMALGLGDTVAYVTNRNNNQISMCQVNGAGSLINCSANVVGLSQVSWITLNYF